MAKTSNSVIKAPPKEAEAEEEADECICCSDPIRVYSIGPCNHKDTCAMCNLKRRLLYKDQKFCPICKEDQTPLVLTSKGHLDHSCFDTSAAAVSRVQAGVDALAKHVEERIRGLLRRCGAPQVPFRFEYSRHLRPSTPDALSGIFCETPEIAYSVSSLLEFSCPICSPALSTFVLCEQR